jgi:hypothetical protein
VFFFFLFIHIFYRVVMAFGSRSTRHIFYDHDMTHVNCEVKGLAAKLGLDICRRTTAPKPGMRPCRASTVLNYSS